MIENQINQILSNVEHLQNGDVSKAMENMGLHYGTNYGVAIPQLKDLASKYKKNNELAFALLGIDVREAKILASFLFDEKTTSIDQLLSISTAINNIELIEQFSRNLFSKTTDIDATLPVIMDVDYWQKVLALYSASWAIKYKHNNGAEIVEWGVKHIKEFFGTDDSMLQKGVSMLMQSVANFNSTKKQDMISLAQNKLSENNELAQKMAREFLMLNMTS